MYVTKTIDSPIGRLKLVASDKGLAGILWENEDPRRVRLAPTIEDATNPFIREAEHQLDAYFKGERDVRRCAGPGPNIPLYQVLIDSGSSFEELSKFE